MIYSYLIAQQLRSCALICMKWYNILPASNAGTSLENVKTARF